VSFHSYLPSYPTDAGPPHFRARNTAVGNLGLVVQIDTDGTVQTYDGSNYISHGFSISTGSYYKFVLENIDYTNDQFDIRVYQNPQSGNPSEVGSVADVSFAESINSIDAFSTYYRETEYYLDELRTYV
jgi:hypothetical protein